MYHGTRARNEVYGRTAPCACGDNACDVEVSVLNVVVSGQAAFDNSEWLAGIILMPAISLSRSARAGMERAESRRIGRNPRHFIPFSYTGEIWFIPAKRCARLGVVDAIWADRVFRERDFERISL